MEELKVGLHIHSILSDGNGTHKKIAEAAFKAGLDAIIITDHNIWVKNIESYISKGKTKLMLLSGEEVHDNTLSEGKNHLLIFGQNRELAQYAPDPNNLIQQAKRSNALAFLAHPIEDPLPLFGERSFSWENWDVNGFTGIELWNQMSEFKTRSQTLPKAILHAFFPHLMPQGPSERSLFLWDSLLASRKERIVAIGGVDAHALRYSLGLFHITLYPYEFQFRSLSTHIITPTKLTGSLLDDKKMVLDALGAGHGFIGYDLPHSTQGFRFTVSNKEGLFWMGDQVSSKNGLTFQVRLPLRTDCRLLRDGKVIAQTRDRDVLTHVTKEPGIYRVEVYLDYLGRKRGWIFSNPIYAID